MILEVVGSQMDICRSVKIFFFFSYTSFSKGVGNQNIFLIR